MAKLEQEPLFREIAAFLRLRRQGATEAPIPPGMISLADFDESLNATAGMILTCFAVRSSGGMSKTDWTKPQTWREKQLKAAYEMGERVIPQLDGATKRIYNEPEYVLHLDLVKLDDPRYRFYANDDNQAVTGYEQAYKNEVSGLRPAFSPSPDPDQVSLPAKLARMALLRSLQFNIDRQGVIPEREWDRRPLLSLKNGTQSRQMFVASPINPDMILVRDLNPRMFPQVQEFLLVILRPRLDLYLGHYRIGSFPDGTVMLEQIAF